MFKVTKFKVLDTDSSISQQSEGERFWQSTACIETSSKLGALNWLNNGCAVQSYGFASRNPRFGNAISFKNIVFGKFDLENQLLKPYALFVCEAATLG